jgi:outer membrane lipoprotein SlyB
LNSKPFDLTGEIMRFPTFIIIATLSILLASCASSNSGSVYSRDDARKVQTVRTGVVESVRNVLLEGTKSPIGTAAGGAIGGIAGGSIGSGRGSSIGAVIGAVAGGIAGAVIEEGVTRKDALEITIKLSGGGLVAIVQEADEQFNPGDSVRIVEGNGTSRVTH